VKPSWISYLVSSGFNSLELCVRGIKLNKRIYQSLGGSCVDLLVSDWLVTSNSQLGIVGSYGGGDSLLSMTNKLGSDNGTNLLVPFSMVNRS